MRVILLLLALLLATSASSSTRARTLLGPQAELFERALAQAGLTTEDVGVDFHDMGFFGGDKYRLPFFDALMADPWKVSPYMRTLGDQLLAPETTIPATLMSLQLRLDQGIRLNLLGDPTEKYAQMVSAAGDDAWRQALEGLQAFVQEPEFRSHFEQDLGFRPDAKFGAPLGSNVPKPVRDAASLYLFALPDIIRQRNEAIVPALSATGLKEQQAYELVIEMLAAEEEDDENSHLTADSLQIEALADNVDFQLLNFGATLAALVAERIVRDLQAAEVASSDFGVQFPTPVGWIELTGGKDDSHGAHPDTALLIDIGGNDQHKRLGFGNHRAPCSVLIDLGGDDTYSNDWGDIWASPLGGVFGDHLRVPSFGAGVFGYGLCIDAGGNDRYNSVRASQGCGIFGTGVLWDMAGGDTYSAVSASQGSAAFGTGLLIDDGGYDTYDCYQLSQGCGYTLGAGLLLDRGGNDVYTANNTDIRFPSAQSAEHNSSLSQGMGMGRRADYTDGHSWAGGVGLLVDGAGDDKYSCAVFGQGCSYWYGVGALLDRTGSDQYSGLWYVQGAGAHFALSVLQDDAGDDKYTATMNMAQGAGHDFTLGWFEDSAGNDSYRAPNLSLGGANANGIGMFWDKAGDDSYLSKGVSLGAGGGVASPSLRQWMLNLGIFVDGGGTDGYWQDAGPDLNPAPWDFAADGKSWQRPGMSSPPAMYEFGLGIDG